MILNIKHTAFNDAYFPLLQNYSHRYEVYYGGAGSGKSVFVTQKLIVKALMSKRKILVVRKFGTTLRDSVFSLFIETLKKWQLFTMCSVNVSHMQIEMPNGSILLFKGFDDPEKIKSITDITDIWIEECTELTTQDVDQLDLRLRASEPNLQMFFSFNPVSKANWTFKKWFSGPYDDATTIVTHTTYKDNRFLPDSYRASLEAKQATNPTYYKIYALGEFCALDKLVFNNWHKEDFDPKSIKGTTLVGMDFGFSNDLSTIVASIQTEDKIYVFRTWGATGKTNTELANVLMSLGLSKCIIVADSAEPKSIEELRRAGIARIKSSNKGPDSIIHGIQKLQNYELVVHPTCDGLIEELENYSWQKDKSGEYINKPIDTFNHYIDALRYSLQCVGSKLKTTSKLNLGL